jgi:glucose-6-phosphate dehydrogenase assembly protein OpcA
VKSDAISCDQITIEASGSEINKVYFLLLPLFAPDLPIYLLWGQDPTSENSILPHLQSFATRLIVDSEAAEDLQAFTRDILNRMETTSLQVIDMNWGRIGGWREVLAQIFDSKERFRQFTSATKIEIFYNDKINELFVHPNTQALYLQAWIASRLGWNYQQIKIEGSLQIIKYLDDKSVREIHLSPKTSDSFDPEEIIQVNVQGMDYECRMTRISAEHIKVHASNQYECLLPFTLIMPTLRSGRNLMQEIFYQKMSDHYTPMLELLSL